MPPQQGPRYCGGVSLSLRTQPFLKRTLSAHGEDELVDEFAVGAAQRVVAAAHFCTAGWSWRRLIALTVFATSLISFGQIGFQQRALFFKALDFGQPALVEGHVFTHTRGRSSGKTAPPATRASPG